MDKLCFTAILIQYYTISPREKKAWKKYIDPRSFPNKYSLSLNPKTYFILSLIKQSTRARIYMKNPRLMNMDKKIEFENTSGISLFW